MKSKWTVGKHLVVRACMAIMACVVVMPVAAGAQAVIQVPTSNRYAGTTSIGYNGDSGRAVNTELDNPTYSVFDSAGNLYISDSANNCVRKVDTSGNMTVIAGYEATAGSADTCNTGGITTITPTQGLVTPQGLAINSAGDLFIADNGHNCIRKLSAATLAAGGGSDNLVTVVDTCSNYGSAAATEASVVPNPRGLILDPTGDEVVTISDTADALAQVVYHKEYPTPDPTTQVCDVAGFPVAGHSNACPFFNGQTYGLNNPTGLAIDAAGNFYLADTGNSCVRELAVGNHVTTPVGVCTDDGSGTNPVANFSPTGLVIGSQGYLYISNANQATVLQYTGGGATPTIYAGIPNAQGTPYTSSQEGIPSVDISLNNPTGLSVDPSGNIYIADSGNGIVRQLLYGAHFAPEPLHDTHGPTQTLAFEINAAVNLTTTLGTDFAISNGNNTCTGSLTPSTTSTPTTCSATLLFDPSYPGLRESPITLTDSISGKAYAFGLTGIGEGANALFSPGAISTLAGSLNTPSAVIVDTAGDIYFAETGSSGVDIKVIKAGTSTPVVVASGNGIQSPVALALDSAQNVYVADNVAEAIFKIDANGNVTTFVSGLDDPVALVSDQDNNLYVAQQGGGQRGIWKVYAGGQKTQISGQGATLNANNVPATSAEYLQLNGLYLDASGNLYVSDAGVYRVYVIDAAGEIHFFAGNGTQTSTNPNEPLTTGLQGPAGLTGDAAGDIYIADGPANLVYVVYAGTGQNPGIQALVGTGAAGDSGDGGPANAAEVNNPISLALDGSDDLYLVDAGNNSVREVSYQNPTLNFPDEKPGVTTPPMSVTLWDAGNETLSPLESFEPTGPDAIDFALSSTDGCSQGGTLLSGSTCVISYTFTPDGVGALPPYTYGNFTSTAVLNDNSVNTQQIITLNGTSPQPTLTVPNVTAVYAQPSFTLTATVTANGPAPTGTIAFAITAPAGNAQTLCASSAVDTTTGTATCTVTGLLLNVLAGGSYTFNAIYSGDSNYDPLTQAATLTITPDPVTITADNVTQPYDTPIPTFTGTITPEYPFPAGQGFTETYSTTAVQTSPPGTYPITPLNPATPIGSTQPGNYAITYVNGTLTITQNGTTTIVAPGVSAVYAQPGYTLSATVNGSISGQTPTGTVTFSIGGQTLCTATLAGGLASCPASTLENVVGSPYTVTVAYGGNVYYPASSSTLNLTITPDPVTITAQNVTQPFGTPIPTFTEVNTPEYPFPAGQGFTDTFTTTATQFSPPGTYPITPGASATPVGSTQVSNYSLTYTNATLTITTNSTGLVFTTTSATAVYAQPSYNLSASVTSSITPGPTGTVTFSIGATTLCVATLSGGSATCASTVLENAGTYSVTAAYAGDTNYAPASRTLNLTITPDPLTITANSYTQPYDTPIPTFQGVIGSPEYPFPAGQGFTDTYATTQPVTQTSPPGTYTIAPAQPATPVGSTLATNYAITYVNGTLTITQLKGITFTTPAVKTTYGVAYAVSASVTSSATPAPTGTVSFTIGGSAICAPATLSASGAASCSPSPTLENASTTPYTVTATYSGDTNYPSSTSTFTLTVLQASVTITANNATRVVDTPNPAFTGTIAPANPFPAGQSITATYATPAVENSAAGNYPIVPTAVAGPNTSLSNYAITLVNGILTITPPQRTSPVGDFTLSAKPPEQEIDIEGSVQFPVTLTSQQNFTDSVSFSCSGLPEGVSCSFAPGTLTPAANATATTVMTLTGTADTTNVPPGSFGAMNAAPVPTPNAPGAPILAWTMLPLGFSGSAAGIFMGRKRKRSGKGRGRFTLWLVPLLLLMAGMSGCGAAANFKIYTVTITGTDSTYATPVTQSTTVQLVLAR